MPNTRSLNTDAAEVLNRIDKLATREDIDELKKLISDLHVKLESQNSEILNLREHINQQDEVISKLEDRVGVLSASVEALSSQNDNQEQYSRRYCLRIKGIDKDANESSKNCIDKVLEVCKKVDVDITSSDIDRAHRVGKEKSTMIVKFFSFEKRTSLYRARKKSNATNIYLDITKKRLCLLDEAKKYIHDDCNVSYVFADINCNTVAKLKNGSFKFFDSIASFNKTLS